MTTKKKQRNIRDLRANVLTIRGALQTQLIERDDSVEALLAAFVLQEHIVFEGPPGTAKSLAVEALMSCIDGRYVRRLMHKFMTIDELVGPMDLAEFQNHQRFVRVRTGGVTQAELVFFDEIFKSNSAVLNGLLTLLEERQYEDQSGRQTVPLRMAAAASNEFPQDASLGALYDRFLFRHRERYIRARGNLKALLKGKASTAKTQQNFVPPCKLTVAEWDRIVADVEKITIGDGILDKYLDFKDLLAAEGITISDRRSVKLLRAFKAAAWLDGESDVDVEHLQILRFVAWDTPAEHEKVLALVQTLERSEVAEVIDQIDEALRVFADRPHDQVRAVQDLPKLLSQIHTVHEGVKARLKAGEFSVRGADKITRRVGELSVAHDQLNTEFSAAVRI